MSKFDDALRFAIASHAGMRRKGDNTPYIVHPLEAATIAATMTANEDVLCAAALHDVIEDTPYTFDDVKEVFGARVAELVAAETENKRHEQNPSDTWLIRKQESLDELRECDEEQKMVWIADKLSNMRSFARMHELEGDAMWSHFHQSDPAMQAWYYRQVLEITRNLEHLSAWRELARLTDIVFEGIS